MQKNTWISIVIVAIAVIAIVLVFVFTNRPAKVPVDNGTATTAVDSYGNPVSTVPGSPAGSGGPTGSNIIKSSPSAEIDAQSDLVSISIAKGAHILTKSNATGIIDSSYTSNGSIQIELADQDYTTTKTVTGYVTGSAKTGNVNFKVTLDTTGIKKGAGYIIFKQVSGNHYARIAVAFD